MNSITRHSVRKDVSAASASWHTPVVAIHNVARRSCGGLSTWLVAHRLPSQSRQANHRSICAAASSLATYRVPLHKPAAHRWFEKSIQELVLHPSRNPVLLLAYAQQELELKTLQLTEKQVWDPHAWPSLCSEIKPTSPQMLILARPIESPEQHCYATEGLKFKQQQSTQPQQQSHSQPSTALCAVSTNNSFEGTLGACCDTDSEEHEPSHSAHAQPPQPDCLHLAAGSSQYYGLVVQAQHRTEVEGCYVLKLSRASNASADCSCLHYTVTRVCQQGPPLQQQLLQAWLTGN